MGPNRARGETPSHMFFLDAEEFEAQPPADAATTEIAVRNAMSTIRSIMTKERGARRRAGLPSLEDQQTLDPRSPREPARLRPPRAQPGEMIARLRAWRPRPAHLGWAGLFLAVLIWPKAVLIAMLAVFILCLIGVALFGQQRLRALGDEVVAHIRFVRARLVPETDENPFEDMPDPFDRLDRAPPDRLGS